MPLGLGRELNFTQGTSIGELQDPDAADVAIIVVARIFHVDTNPQGETRNTPVGWFMISRFPQTEYPGNRDNPQ